jgi:ankyrin repeat protein
MSKVRAFEAALALDVDGVRELLARQPALLAATDRQGRNLLLAACSVHARALGLSDTRAPRLVQLLLDAGMDVESAVLADGYPCTAVWFAVARGRNPKVVELLVARGAKARGLFAAGWHEDLPMLRLLLRLGAELDEHAEDETPFLHCWKNRRWKAAELLLRAGADVNFQDPKGMTALHYALKKGYAIERVRLLMKHGASAATVDEQGISAAVKAARKRDPAYRAIVR